MTIAEALREAAVRLSEVSDTARLDAELLMAEALGVSRSDVLLRRMADPSPDSFAGLVDRRLQHEPVAQILGRKEFYGREFHVGRAVLTPRPDSETIVNAALEAVPMPRCVLDLGTGSGALLLTLLAERPQAEGIGIDASTPALEVASRNAETLGLEERSRLLRRDWNEAGWNDDLGDFDLIVSNPPYVEDSAGLAPSVHNYEPAEALYAGPEGLDAYRALIPQLSSLLVPKGAVVLEIGATQADAVMQLAATHGFTTTLRRDLANRPRALILRLRLGKELQSG